MTLPLAYIFFEPSSVDCSTGRNWWTIFGIDAHWPFSLWIIINSTLEASASLRTKDIISFAAEIRSPFEISLVRGINLGNSLP